MRNPLSFFRRHQKILLAVFGVVIMITFTIGGSIDWYQGSQIRSGQDTDVVVTWKHGKWRRGSPAIRRRGRSATLGFHGPLEKRTWFKRRSWRAAPRKWG